MTLLASRKLRIEPFAPHYAQAVQAFGNRLAAAGVGPRFPGEPAPDWLAQAAGSEVCQQLFVMLEGEEVRGVYGLQRRPVAIRGEMLRARSLHMPISEGTINRAYSLVRARLLSDAMQRESLLFALGVGGAGDQLSGTVRALGWPVFPVPFFFKVVNANRFLRQIRYLRTTRLRARLLDVAAFSGIGWAIAAAAGAILTRRPRGLENVRAEEVERFGDWSDALWRSCAPGYSFAAVRTADILNRAYPPARTDLLRLRVRSADRTIGYVVLQDEQFLASETMGQMRVGTVLDVFARPEDAESVIWLALQRLMKQRVDLLISNQAHPAWGAALRRAGFIEGPSNCVFATSRALADRIRAGDPDAQELHLSRGEAER